MRRELDKERIERGENTPQTEWVEDGNRWRWMEGWMDGRTEWLKRKQKKERDQERKRKNKKKGKTEKERKRKN